MEVRRMNRQRSVWLAAVAVFSGILIFLILMAIGVFTEDGSEKSSYKIILIPKTVDEKNDFWTSLMEGAEMAAAEFGAEITIRGGCTEEDYETQNRLIEESIEEEPSALLIAPCDYEKTSEAVKKAVNAGIKVILIDSVVEDDITQGIVATDNFKAGEELGNYARKLLDHRSKIGVVAHVQGSSTASEREDGIRAGLGAYEQQICDTVYCNSSYDLAYSLTNKMLDDNPDINMVIGTNEYAAVGADRAIPDRGLAGKVDKLGYDNSVEQIQYLEAGIFQAIVIQKPFNMGYLGVKQAVAALTGEAIESDLDSGCKLITRENMYEDENQKLLYPFRGQQ